MNEQSDHELAIKIASLLDRHVSELEPQTATKLLEARKAALSRYKDQEVLTWVPAWAGGAVARVAEPHHYNFRLLAATVAFIAAFAFALSWQSITQGSSEVADVDAGLLTDDLPINAYLDRGFDSWLKRPSP